MVTAPSETEIKYSELLEFLQTFKSALIAFSGGVDSTFLVAAVKESGIPYLAVTALSPTMPSQDKQDVRVSVDELSLKHSYINSCELDVDDFVKNSPERCFYCKNELFQLLTKKAEKEGYAAVFDGSTTDDLNDYRPGSRAKNEFNVISPIQEVGLSKEDIRKLSKKMGLKSWSKPASPCLSSRISYGEPILPHSLQMVESAENTLRDMGFGVLRVRKQDETARIELTDPDITRLLDSDLRKKVTEELLKVGFKFVALDLEGFRSGKLNRVIPDVNIVGV
ncbi:MAG: ATP-dependent sacrificial sulfur transferase LarE [Magnetococcales bacterium]|nr:ATP-dependent sacrificial sulfur transferase LarE [Magnetococcales bacterium]